MTGKSIEIYYNISDIPDITDRSAFSSEALEFRNAAMEHVENALLAGDLGEWDGADIGETEVNFGFSVEDFEQAEAVVKEAVAGTRFANIREIVRNEYSEEDLAEMTGDAKPLGLWGLLSLLLFRRLPKRFRDN
ncbi:hypothetical protein [Ruegeria sp.]|uniref:hypothetical protein n=1 Tax=Ruegeria sp. TaxID=1879320 RepID=UPI00230C9EEA|nr:hypothetical protein [Ruegeria sp.]MDA7965763.1 hypothetical protein [Ruegeria sp.]